MELGLSFILPVPPGVKPSKEIPAVDQCGLYSKTKACNASQPGEMTCWTTCRRFISRRGQVSELRSDNGTNLISTENELREALKRWNMDQI
ncbi:hypothetical protein D4764_10G0012140 [Takifugu flavidus]|uniref:Uncharacterized protein n=2 Tax=Takifugu flavidus TaxID=433684 RepID=A0A5C6PKB1_9TELE|nr:hypothetical protein D4764_0293350 [Takifugu flavidus]TWW80184.1 hypothetical protein D4764_10G0012140 [Takifugu flavidus]